MTRSDHDQLRKEQAQMAREKEMRERSRLPADNHGEGMFKQEDELGADQPEVVRTNKKRDLEKPTPKTVL